MNTAETSTSSARRLIWPNIILFILYTAETFWKLLGFFVFFLQFWGVQFNLVLENKCDFSPHK